LATEYLFVYGTLHPERAPAEMRPVVRRMTYLGPGEIEGVVHHLEGYPGLILNRGPEAMVQGSVFGLPDDPGVLEALDRYEDFRADDLAASLFVRVKRAVRMGYGARLECWVYVYNREIP